MQQDRDRMYELGIVEEAARRILQENCDPVVRFRLLRDVLKTPPASDTFTNARREMLQSRWITELRNEQRDDGSWGRFHSAVKCEGKIVTTEAAVERGLALGLGATDSIFQTTITYLTGLLNGKIAFPDPPERNNRWRTGTQLFAAATLARICPTLPVLDEPWRLWVEIGERTFVSGKYDEEAEIRAHEVLTGASVKDSYLMLNNRYQLELLGSRAAELPRTLENALVNWAWHKDNGVGYLEIPLANPPHRFTPGMLDRLFTSLEIISRFPSWRMHAKSMIDWIWTQRNIEGIWDFGSRASTSVYFPLSESWRKSKSQKQDWSTRVLTLLRSSYDS